MGSHPHKPRIVPRIHVPSNEAPFVIDLLKEAHRA